jgi:hypothetical protein
VALEAIHDEVDMLAWDQGDGLLDHVVAVLVFGNLEEVGFQLPCQLSLLLNQDVLERLGNVSFGANQVL